MRNAGRFAAAALILGLTSDPATAQKRVSIGIVNGQLDRASAQSFEPFTSYMASRIPGTRFEIVPLATIEDLVHAGQQKQLEFVFATPTALVELNVRDCARAIATVLQPVAGGGNYPWLAGAVFVRNSRSDLRRLQDVRNRRVIALSPLALGGWLSAVREWRKLGIEVNRDFGSLRFVFSYSKVAKEVCDGTADAGVLSASALMLVESQCGEKFRVLPAIGGMTDSRYPAEVSTALYPEEAFAVVGTVPEALVSRVEIALLAIEPGSPAARAVTVAGFTPPLSYGPVQQLMEELHLRPFEAYGRSTFREVIEQHWHTLLLVLSTFLVILGWALVRSRRLNARLQTSEAFRKRVFDGSHLPVVVMDADTHEYVDSNPAAVEIYGFSSQEETRRKTLLDVSAPVQYDGSSSRGRIPEIIDKALREGKTVFEWRHQRPDGAVWDAQVHLMRFDYDDRRLLQFTLEDITSRKRADADRERLEDQLRQSQKLESIGRMAGGIAHDFNNLLTVINGYTEMLLHGEKLTDAARQSLAQVYSAGERAAELTRQLLAFSKRQILQPVPLDLNRLINDSDQMFARLLGEDIRLVLSLEAELSMVTADPGQIHQALMNLVANARDAMPRGGILTISTAEVRRDAAELPGELATGVYCLLEVSDTGIGIDEAVREHIFEPFFSTKGEHGTGLGLATVYGIVRQSKGGIAVLSEAGMGTTFRIYLPRTGYRPEPEPVQIPEKTLLKGSATILLVEDQEEVRGFAREVLDLGGYRVLEAPSGEAAMNVALTYPEPIDLLLTDVVLGGMNGMELSKQYLSVRTESRVLFTSGYTDNVMARRGVILGSIAFVPKPYSPADLLKKIADVLNEPRNPVPSVKPPFRA